MLVQAQKKNIYSELAVADVEGYMRAQADAGFDMVVAADVFVYRGELLEVFKQTHRILKHGGLFAFTVSADRVC
jgi:predicted TPR repeat methyltransferase